MKKEDLKIHNWDIEKIFPNPWNPNMTSKRVDEAIRESIGIYGMVDPVTCRRHPEIVGALQIIDGEHRLEACKEMELSTIPVVIVDVNDANAKKLTIIANETRGRAEKQSLAQLVAEIAEELDVDSFRLGLPFYAEELENMLEDGDSAGEIDPAKEWEGMPEYQNENVESWKQLVVHFENEQDFLKFQELVGQELNEKTKSIHYPKKERLDLINYES